MPTMPNLTLADLTPDPENARSHSDRNIQTIRTSIEEVGAARSIVVDENGVILAGNATVKAAEAAGLRLHVVDTDGRTLIAVRRAGLTASQKRRLALADNRAAELATWDVGQLQAFDSSDLAGLWTTEEQAKMFGAPDELDASPQMGAVEYRVIIECRSEDEQAALLEELEGRGLSVKALMS